ncbi:MAG TPA: gamma-glutamyl-gamma-aminobutyrate hydrolase family protein [Gemmataceae bacterium]|nr:gamma-glutamyl-gamma-aminobutyrate hydrolase family protein [Gemmataceae bacterium]
MSVSLPTIRIGICGTEEDTALARRQRGIWPVGYPGIVAAAGAEPVILARPQGRRTWTEILREIHGVVYAGNGNGSAGSYADEQSLCLHCRDRKIPLLAIDNGLQTMNATFGGSVYLDLAREVPEALQHRHPPEPGLRHAIMVERGTRLAELYGEGEIVVNSEHRQAVCRLARGFRVSARALDGVIEAIELEGDDWFALGVQWRPASSTASGLDIQLFRGLIQQAEERQRKPMRKVAPRRQRQLLSA